MNRSEFKEELLFNKYKDTKICNSDWLRSRYSDNDVNLTRLYTRIVNYQVDRYGHNLAYAGRQGVDYADTKKDITKDKKGQRKWNSKKEF
jgi:hypothetical protein